MEERYAIQPSTNNTLSMEEFWKWEAERDKLLLDAEKRAYDHRIEFLKEYRDYAENQKGILVLIASEYCLSTYNKVMGLIPKDQIMEDLAGVCYDYFHPENTSRLLELCAEEPLRMLVYAFFAANDEGHYWTVENWTRALHYSKNTDRERVYRLLDILGYVPSEEETALRSGAFVEELKKTEYVRVCD